jgi:cardiolipin synthase
MIINSVASQKPYIRTKLDSMAQRFENLKILDFSDRRGRQLHAKIIVSDRKKALVGSSNLTWGGMFGNCEIGLLVDGAAAWKLAELADALAATLR